MLDFIRTKNINLTYVPDVIFKGMQRDFVKIEDFTWEIKSPSQVNVSEPWMQELSQLRGEVFYDQGRRPAFLNASGEYEDRDAFDSMSIHILVYDEKQSHSGMLQKKLIGAIRFLPLETSSYHCISSSIAGYDKFKMIIQTLFPSPANLVEINRLVVHKGYHDYRVGVYLCAAVLTLADDLHYHSIANANVEVLNLFYLKHAGGVLYPRYAGPYSSSYYNDNEIYFLYIDKNRYTTFFKRQMEKIRNIIPFEEIESKLLLETPYLKKIRKVPLKELS